MRKGISAWTVGLPLALAVFWTASAVPAAQQEPATAPASCVLTVEGNPLSISTEPVTLKASYSDDIGKVKSANFPADSKITLVGAKQDVPQSLELTVDTSQAAPGEWKLTVMGEQGECTGDIKVASGGAASK